MEKSERVVAALSERLEMHDNSRRTVQESLHNACNELRKFIDEMEEGVNRRLEEEFTKEDNRLQSTLNELRECIGAEEEGEGGDRNAEHLSDIIQKAVTELLVMQSYELVECEAKEGEGGVSKMFDVKTEKKLVPEWVLMKRPTILNVPKVSQGRIYLEMTGWVPSEKVTDLKDGTSTDLFTYKVIACKEGEEEEEGKTLILRKEEAEGKGIFSFNLNLLELETTYKIRAKITYADKESEWSDAFELRTPEFSGSSWKKCPDNVENERRYVVDENNPTIVTKTGDKYCTVIGSVLLPPNKTTSMCMKILKSLHNNGLCFFIGVAPSDIDLNNKENHSTCGWYFSCHKSVLCSGPPHNYDKKEYGPRIADGHYVRTGDSVGIIMDTAKGELSFALNGMNLGVAYKGIPLDKPLVPCAILGLKDDSVELDISEIKEKVNECIPIPFNIKMKNITWNSITYTWDAVEGASFYQIEVDGSVHNFVTETTHTVEGLFPESSHSFRARTVRGSSVSKWSDAVRGKTKVPNFLGCVWKECPSYVWNEKKKYSFGLWNARVAKKTGGNGFCTIVGNTALPLNKVNSWNIKILRSKCDDGNGIFVGVAPLGIDQNDDNNLKQCGWYLSCFSSTLFSGPPHSYRGTECGPRKEQGKYVRTGDSVGVMMNTSSGELSFILNTKYLDETYEGIPLDKPLVPCVILYYEGASVEFSIKKLEQETITF